MLLLDVEKRLMHLLQVRLAFSPPLLSMMLGSYSTVERTELRLEWSYWWRV